MSYIAPNTTILLLHNVPLDNTYEHTLWFGGSGNAGREAQANFFRNTYQKRSFTNQTYQRVRKGWLRIQANSEEIYDCNYLMFQSTRSVDGSNYGKWFYCFVTAVEYVNENVCEIRYELDYMQTWYFDYTVKQCFVEREHSRTDNLFENLADENLDLGDDFVCVSNSQALPIYSKTCIVILMNRKYNNSTGQLIQLPPALFNYTYSDCMLIAGDSDGLFEIDPNAPTSTENVNTALRVANLINSYAEASILNIFQVPSVLVNNTILVDPSVINVYTNIYEENRRYEMVTSLDGYVPKNKKLYNYPFNFLQVYNFEGDVANYKFENFNKGSGSTVANFTINGVLGAGAELYMWPNNYLENNTIGQDYSFVNGIDMTEFQQCPFSGNPFIDWLSRNKNSIDLKLKKANNEFIVSTMQAVPQAMNNAVDMISGVTGIVKGEYDRGVPQTARAVNNLMSNAINQGANYQSIYYGVKEIMAQGKDMANSPRTMKNAAFVSNLIYATQKKDFHVLQVCIKRYFAERIDKYFSVYGYACKQFKTPEIANRPHWNFIKTNGCCAVGSVPADDMNAICKIYDKGVTFWKNANEIGDYSLDNSPRN